MVVLMSACVGRIWNQVIVFGVQLDSLKISLSAKAEKRADFIGTFLLVRSFWTAPKVNKNHYRIKFMIKTPLYDGMHKTTLIHLRLTLALGIKSRCKCQAMVNFCVLK